MPAVSRSCARPGCGRPAVATLSYAYADGTVWLEDLGSTNGTTTEGQPLNGQVQLHDRQEFTCGQSTFMLLIRVDDWMAV